MEIPDDVSRKRTICYVDGFNLYFGLRDSGLRHCLWLNIREMAAKMVRNPYVLAGTKYFTARVSGARPTDSPDRGAQREASRLRQGVFLVLSFGDAPVHEVDWEVVIANWDLPFPWTPKGKKRRGKSP